MNTDKTSDVKTVTGPKGACATFIRPRDNQRIFVFQRKRESVDAAIQRVKKHNGASEVSHDLVK